MLFFPKNSSMVADDFERLVAPVRRRMVDGVWRIVRDVHETEDVMQEVLVQVFERFEEVRRHPNPTALLLRMCANKALDHVRQRQTRVAAMDGLAELPETVVGATPARELAQAEDRRVVIDFLRTLPEREAEAITLHVLEELDYPAVAEAMGCAQSTVRVLIGRARARFREAFSRESDGLGDGGRNHSNPSKL